LRSVLLILALWPSAPAQDKADATPVEPIKIVSLQRTSPIDFDRDVQPILARRCLVCHSGSVTEGMLDLSKHEKMLEGGKRGPALLAGKAADSLLIQMAGKTKKPFMPPKKEVPLSPEELATLKLWIDQGAKAGSGKSEKALIALTPPPTSVHPVRAIVISADQSLVVAARGNQILVFDATGKPLRSLVAPELRGPDQKPVPAAHLSLVEALALSSDGKTLASGSFQEVNLWDPLSGKLLRRLTGFAERVVCLAFAPDGKLLAAGGGVPTEPGEILIFDVASGKQTLDIKPCHSDTVFGLSFSPDGKRLASAGADKFVKVFDIANGKLLKSFEGHTEHVMDVGWKADGKLLASGGADRVIKVWDYEKGEQTRTFGNLTKPIMRLAFKGKTSEILVCSGDRNVRVWNIDNGSGGMTFSGATDYVYAVAVSADGKLVSTGGEDGIVRIYNGGNGQLVKAIPPDTAKPAEAASK
jgi:Planctomycete cytochrome C/WD domain, G-beta repeat